MAYKTKKPIKQDVPMRGTAFLKKLSMAVPANRRINDDVFLLDNYTFSSVLKKPIKVNYGMGIQVMEGEGVVVVNDNQFKYKAPCIIVFLSRQVIQHVESTDCPTQARMMVLSERFTEELFDMALRMNEIYSTFLLNPIIELDENNIKSLENYVSSTKSIVERMDNLDRNNSLKFLTLALFYGALNTVFTPKNKAKSVRATHICSEFMVLVKEHFRTEHSASFYSDKLDITERYLYMTVRAVTGHSAAYWIDFYILAEAKMLLNHTNLSILEVSEKLNFHSQSDFGKFFKRMTGVSPLRYRKARY